MERRDVHRLVFELILLEGVLRPDILGEICTTRRGCHQFWVNCCRHICVLVGRIVLELNSTSRVREAGSYPTEWRLLEVTGCLNV